MRRTGIVGSRHFPEPRLVASFVSGLASDAIVVSGGAPGVDTWAVEAAASRGLGTLVFEADWALHGRKAGPIRNKQIVDAVDEIVAFWDGRSRGTLGTVALALEAGLPARVFDGRGDPMSLDVVMREIRDRGVFASLWREEAGLRTAPTGRSKVQSTASEHVRFQKRD